MLRYILITTLLLFSFFAKAQAVREFILDDVEGETLSYDELKGEQLTIIDFWASWCKPCMKALPKLDKLYKAYEAKGVAFISINTDGPRSISKVMPLVRTLGVSYPILSDINNDVMQDLEIGVLPTLLLVDADNNIVYRHEGFSDGDELDIEHELKKHLNLN
ncbi:TlpA family protein disulfide reductase [Carboxylicivirga sp. N1Y90]|uniref:TlpA family protein disulfide reductase n=1 Tax=Carboxylicivirga fragile TaxID=3417571 RepID=UPI003D357124|nr:TlpA family protein disulfide reductase [Marinilabiliaceae bacterium N1Y90]